MMPIGDETHSRDAYEKLDPPLQAQYDLAVHAATDPADLLAADADPLLTEELIENPEDEER
jgi:hypothetical protein